ncbi:hypothetical protein ACHAWF_012049 [Thalassiosira exigua]
MIRTLLLLLSISLLPAVVATSSIRSGTAFLLGGGARRGHVCGFGLGRGGAGRCAGRRWADFRPGAGPLWSSPPKPSASPPDVVADTAYHASANRRLVERRIEASRGKRAAREKASDDDRKRNLRLRELFSDATRAGSDAGGGGEAVEGGERRSNVVVPPMFAVKVVACPALRSELRMNGRERRGRMFVERPADFGADSSEEGLASEYHACASLRALKKTVHEFFRRLKKSTYVLSASLPILDEEGNVLTHADDAYENHTLADAVEAAGARSEAESESDAPDASWPLESDEDVRRAFLRAEEFYHQHLAENATSTLKRPTLVLHVTKDPNAPPPPPPPPYLQHMPDPSSSNNVTMLSFYSFPPNGISDPEEVAERLRKLWKPFGARGRIYVANEGINAQMSVPTNVLSNFRECCHLPPATGGKLHDVLGDHVENGINVDPIPVSKEEHDRDPPFVNLHVRVRSQIVADGLEKPLDWTKAGKDETDGAGGTKGTNDEEDDPLPVVLDCRNDYETRVGRFDLAEPLGTENFRDSWDVLREKLADVPKDRPVMTYCTVSFSRRKRNGTNERRNERKALDGGEGRRPTTRGMGGSARRCLLLPRSRNRRVVARRAARWPGPEAAKGAIFSASFECLVAFSSAEVSVARANGRGVRRRFRPLIEVMASFARSRRRRRRGGPGSLARRGTFGRRARRRGAREVAGAKSCVRSRRVRPSEAGGSGRGGCIRRGSLERSDSVRLCDVRESLVSFRTASSTQLAASELPPFVRSTSKSLQGGIRCVKVNAYLTQELGFTDVSRLAGGVVAYDRALREEAPAEEPLFKGVNYVFDGRMGRRITEDRLGTCHTCGAKTSLVTNCRNENCHRRMVQCERCRDSFFGTCSEGCKGRVVSVAGKSLLAADAEEEKKEDAIECKNRETIYSTLDEYGSAHSTEPAPLLREIEANTAALLPTGAHMVSGAAQGTLLTTLASLSREGRVLEVGTFTGYATACFLEGARAAGRSLAADGPGTLEGGGPFVLSLERDRRALGIAAAHVKAMAERGVGVEGAREAARLRSDGADDFEGDAARFAYDDVAGCELRRANDALAAVEEMASEGAAHAPFDIAFVDADKTRLMEYMEALIGNDRVLKRGGLVVVDNVLWKGLVLDAAAGYDSSDEMEVDRESLRRSRRARKLANIMHNFNSAIVKDSRVDVLLMNLRDGLSLIRKR